MHSLFIVALASLAGMTASTAVQPRQSTITKCQDVFNKVHMDYKVPMNYESTFLTYPNKACYLNNINQNLFTLSYFSAKANESLQTVEGWGNQSQGNKDLSNQYKQCLIGAYNTFLASMQEQQRKMGGSLDQAIATTLKSQMAQQRCADLTSTTNQNRPTATSGNGPTATRTGAATTGSGASTSGIRPLTSQTGAAATGSGVSQTGGGPEDDVTPTGTAATSREPAPTGSAGLRAVSPMGLEAFALAAAVAVATYLL